MTQNVSTTENATIAKTQMEEIITPLSHKLSELEVHNFQKKPVYSFFKRLFDIVVSAVCLIILFIPMVIIGLCVVCNSKGPMFYKQERAGKNSKPFNIYKFRTMITDAEKQGAQWAVKNDPRITSVGRVLRNTHLDELPQLWNILKGEMSFVGPRPEREVFIKVIEEHIPSFRQRTLVRPGLTGLTQIGGQYELSPEERMVLDVEYIEKRSILLDLKCVFLTVPVMISHKGAR